MTKNRHSQGKRLLKTQGKQASKSRDHQPPKGRPTAKPLGGQGQMTAFDYQLLQMKARSARGGGASGSSTAAAAAAAAAAITLQPSLLQRAVAEQNHVRHYADHLLLEDEGAAGESPSAFSSIHAAPPTSERLHPRAAGVAPHERQQQQRANMFTALDDSGDEDAGKYKVTLQPSALGVLAPASNYGYDDDDDDL